MFKYPKTKKKIQFHHVILQLKFYPNAKMVCFHHLILLHHVEMAQHSQHLVPTMNKE